MKNGQKWKRGICLITLVLTAALSGWVKQEAAAGGKPPGFTVTYTEASRLVDRNGRDHPDSLTPEAGYVSYYKTDIKALIKMKAEKAPEGTDGFYFAVNGEDAGQDIAWKEKDGVYEGSYRLSEEGEYVLTASCSDAGEVYTSPKLVIDKTPPVVEVSYSAEPMEVYGNRKYFNEAVEMKIEVTEENFRLKELKEVLAAFTAADGAGKDLRGSVHAGKVIQEYADTAMADGGWAACIPLDTDAFYDIPISYTDLAGNPAVWKDGEETGRREERLCVDRTGPLIDGRCTAGFNALVNAVNYKDFGYWFTSGKSLIGADVTDETAGIRKIRVTAADEGGEETAFEWEISREDSYACEIEAPLEKENFKGTIAIEAVDWCGNAARLVRSCIAESEGKHGSAGNAKILTKTSPKRTVDGVDYYNSDVELFLLLEDTHSGLGEFSYTGGNTLAKHVDYMGQAGREFEQEPVQEIAYRFSEALVLEAGANNQNGNVFRTEYTDNAGHAGFAEEVYHIDVTPPEITVEYDLDTPFREKYYNQTRTAAVTIRERNFDARDVEFMITNTDGSMPAISGWSSSGSGDDTLHTCTVVFQEDGDYTFTLAFQDMAGNRAEYGRIDSFTIDQTPPKMRARYDNNAYQNEKYYAAKRSLFIEVEEHNFDESLMDVRISREDGGSAPVLSEWSRDGDTCTAYVVFSDDGGYSVEIEGKDLAENPLAENFADAFVMDGTPPVLEILDVQDKSANNGAIMPKIRCTDTNLDPGSVEVSLRGWRKGVQEVKGSQKSGQGEMEIHLEDFPYTQSQDDLYILEASACDMAGNQSIESIVFSVNRYGSVYTFDEKTDRLAGPQGDYYTCQEQELVVTETNVDALEFREITCNFNGKLRTLQEGKDYRVEKSGSEEAWKQYTYVIYKDNFKGEGNYLLTLYSRDRARNPSDSSKKKKRIAFAVDKTAPSVLYSGVADKGRYWKNRQEITLDIQDNICLSEVKVNINGRELVYDTAAMEKMEGRIRIQAEKASRWQEMTVTACDAAGNRKRTETIRFLITSNLLVQLLRNRLLSAGAIGGGLLLAAGAGGFLWRKRRRGMKDAADQGRGQDWL